jgi:hypothetical protein
MTFASSAVRATAIPSPTEGMTTFRADSDSVEVYNGASYVPVNKNVVTYSINNAATLTVATTTETSFFTAPTFTPIVGRLYEITYTVGTLTKTTGAGNITFRLRKDTTAGTIVSSGIMTAVPVGQGFSFSRTTIADLGSIAFIPNLTIQASVAGFSAANTAIEGYIVIKDIGTV